MNDPKRELAERIADAILNAHAAKGDRVEIKLYASNDYIYGMDRGAFISRIERELGHLGAVPPLVPSGQDEKIPTAGAGRLADRATQIACAALSSYKGGASKEQWINTQENALLMARNIEQEAAK